MGAGPRQQCCNLVVEEVTEIFTLTNKTLGYDHYQLHGHSVLDARIDQKGNPTNQLKRKLKAVEGRTTYMDADKQEAATRNVRQRVCELTPAVREVSRTKGREKQVCNGV